MEKNVNAIINLMKTLEVSLEDVTQALLNPTSTTPLTASEIQEAIENESVSLNTIFPAQSKAWNMLVDFIASDSFLGGFPTNIAPPVTEDKIDYAYTKCGLKYALYDGNILGIVIRAQSLHFVLALHNYGQNIDIRQAREKAERLPSVTGKKWIVPSDANFHSVRAIGLKRVNEALRELKGDEIGGTPFLSSTSQASPPHYWHVRFILPLD